MRHTRTSLLGGEGREEAAMTWKWIVSEEERKLEWGGRISRIEIFCNFLFPWVEWEDVEERMLDGMEMG